MTPELVNVGESGEVKGATPNDPSAQTTEKLLNRKTHSRKEDRDRKTAALPNAPLYLAVSCAAFRKLGWPANRQGKQGCRAACAGLRKLNCPRDRADSFLRGPLKPN